MVCGASLIQTVVDAAFEMTSCAWCVRFEQQNGTTQALFRSFVAQGRIELVGGGCVDDMMSLNFTCRKLTVMSGRMHRY